MEIEFVSSMAVITADPPSSRSLYIGAIGLPLDNGGEGDYYHSEKIGGTKHFGVWPLAEAAESCFGTREWPADRPVPQASVEFEVSSPEAVSAAEAELVAAVYDLLHTAKTEPWGQTVAHFQSPEGLVLGISYAPWMHEGA